MSCITSLFLTLLCTFLLHCCSAGNITAYVEEKLVSTTCETVTAVPSVCNIDWKVSSLAAEDYDGKIELMRSLILSTEIVDGLNDTQAATCRKEYARMTCKKYFPVCDMKTLTVDYGNATALCQRARNACTTIVITDDCATVKNGKHSFVVRDNQCLPIKGDISKVCRPNLKMKVPRKTSQYTEFLVSYLSKMVKTFDEKTRNLTGMDKCTKNYKEVLCRMIKPCSPDEYYALYLIGKKECEAMISCAVNYDLSLNVDISICATLPNVEKSMNVSMINPFPRDAPEVPENLPHGQTTTRAGGLDENKGQPTTMSTTVSEKMEVTEPPIMTVVNILTNRTLATEKAPESNVGNKTKNRGSAEKINLVGFALSLFTVALLKT